MRGEQGYEGRGERKKGGTQVTGAGLQAVLQGRVLVDPKAEWTPKAAWA